MRLSDRGLAKDGASILNRSNVADKGFWKTRWVLEKFKGDLTAEECENAVPYEVLEFEGNILLNEGINEMWKLICGGTATPFNNANARLGVGDGTTAEDATQTGLQGINTAYKAMDSGYPTYGTAQKATFRATFGGTEANFAWEEVVVDNGATAGVTMNRKVQSLGSKASGTTWQLTCEITLS